MANITFARGVDLLPSIQDISEWSTNMVLVSSSASQVVLENAFTRITLNASAGAGQFSFTPLYGDYPSGGTIATVSVDVFTSAAGVTNYFSIDYGVAPVYITGVLAPGYWGYGLAFYGQNLLTGSDVLTGTASADWLQAGGGNDTLEAAAGNDTLDGGYGNDSMVGGAGNDVYVIDASADVVSEALNGGIDTVAIGSGVMYTMADNVENAEVAPTLINPGYYAYANVTGNALGNIIRGAGGPDTLNGGDGADRLFGGTSNDSLNGGTGADTMVGGDGDDTYVVDAAGDRIIESFLASNLRDLVVSSINYTLGDNLDNLTLSGVANINGSGNALANRIIGNVGNNVLNGAAGIDTLSYETAVSAVTVALNVAGAQVTGGGGTDTVSNFENLVGGSAADSLTGSASGNAIDGGFGADTMTGLGGDDSYTVDSAADVVVEVAGGGTDLISSAVSYVLGTAQENLTLTGYQTVNGTGNTVDNVIVGNQAYNDLKGLGGNDTITGGYGNDTLNGGVGADYMSGEAGSDTFYVDNANDVVVDIYDYYNSETNTVIASVNYTLGANLDNLQLTGTALRGAGNGLNNVITANGQNNVLNGGLGIDTLSYAGTAAAVRVSLALTVGQATGGSGTDALRNFENLTGGNGNDSLTGSAKDNVLDGGTGVDTLVGGVGNDTYLVDAGGDVVTELAAAGTDLVLASATYTLGANVENLTLSGDALINGTGNAGSNYLLGNSQANQLNGAGGADTLNGGYGNDSLEGGLGNDTFLVDSLNDVVSDSGGVDTVVYDSYYFSSPTPYVLQAGIENLTLTTSYSYGSYYFSAGTGNDLNNTLTGNAAQNVLSGAGGNDTILGGANFDSLTGGTGNDAFVFDAPLADTFGNPAGFDRITDFSVADDTIWLDDEVFSALPVVAAGTLQAGNFRLGTVAADADDRIVYDGATGALFYDPDGNGIQAQVKFAEVTAGLALTLSDFLIV